jgi:hypothetical protein
MKFLVLFCVCFLFAGFALADDPGERDSLIIETVFANLGDSSVDVRIFATTDDSVVCYVMPLIWHSDNVMDICPTDITYNYPLTLWDDIGDSIFHDDSFIRMWGWENGGSSAPPIFTNNYRQHYWTIHFAIDSLANAQIVTIDTTNDPIMGPLLFGLTGGIIQLIPEFMPGAIYYGTTPVSSDESRFQPSEFSLHQNYPNPFNVSTTIEFTLQGQAKIELSVYNILGQKVVVLYNGIKPAGYHSLMWNADGYPSGVYFARLETKGYSKSIKMVLLK